MTIEKATVTVTALDKSAYVGSKAPDLSNPVEDTDYTVSDLFGDDQLTGTIKLTYYGTTTEMRSSPARVIPASLSFAPAA